VAGEAEVADRTWDAIEQFESFFQRGSECKLALVKIKSPMAGAILFTSIMSIGALVASKIESPNDSLFVWLFPLVIVAPPVGIVMYYFLKSRMP
jgi:hypothetical protein